MAIYRQLRIELQKDQRHWEWLMGRVLSELSKVDPHACLLPLEAAIASRSLVKKLWDLLPDESDSYACASVEEEVAAGKIFLPADLRQNVTLHLGWDVLAFSCSLEAAWNTWEQFHSFSTETFNCCIYPKSLEWYLVRAGGNIYPMTFTGDRYTIKK